MKKIFLSFIIIFSISFSVYSAGFKNRYIELNFNMKAGVSNSSFYLVDILQEELIIDLPALSDTVPNSGFSLNLYARPNLNLNFDLRKFFLGLGCGVEFQNVTTISKDFFDFLSKGNELREPINIDTSLDTDVFLFFDATLGFYCRTWKVNVTPSVFFPVLHSEISKSNISIENTSDGAIIFNMDNQLDVYSQFDAASLNDFKNGAMGNIDAAGLFNAVGFDLAGSVDVPVRSGFTLIAYARIPIIPARLNKMVSTNLNASADFNMMKIINDEDGKDFDFSYSDFTDNEGEKQISRPLKVRVGMNWDGFRSWFNVYADLGFGVRYPFTNQAKFYLEYYLGLDLSLFNITGVSVFTQYRDLVYSNNINFFINTRVFELDFGASIESTTFVGAFKISGLGVYVGASVGF